MVTQELKELIEKIKNNAITGLELALQQNEISTQEAQKLAEALSVNSSISELSMDWGERSIEGTKIIAEVLKRNEVITFLDLGWGTITTEGVKILAEVLSENKRLIHVSLPHNMIDDEGINALDKALKENKNIIDFSIISNEIDNLILSNKNEAVELAKSYMEIVNSQDPYLDELKFDVEFLNKYEDRKAAVEFILKEEYGYDVANNKGANLKEGGKSLRIALRKIFLSQDNIAQLNEALNEGNIVLNKYYTQIISQAQVNKASGVFDYIQEYICDQCLEFDSKVNSNHVNEINESFTPISEEIMCGDNEKIIANLITNCAKFYILIDKKNLNSNDMIDLLQLADFDILMRTQNMIDLLNHNVNLENLKVLCKSESKNKSPEEIAKLHIQRENQLPSIKRRKDNEGFLSMIELERELPSQSGEIGQKRKRYDSFGR